MIPDGNRSVAALRERSKHGHTPPWHALRPGKASCLGKGFPGEASLEKVLAVGVLSHPRGSGRAGNAPVSLNSSNGVRGISGYQRLGGEAQGQGTACLSFSVSLFASV